MSDQETSATNAAEQPVDQAAEQPIDPALMQKLDYLRQLVNVDNLLQKGLYPGVAAAPILDAQSFLKAIHAAVLAEAKAHPDFTRMEAGQGKV